MNSLSSTSLSNLSCKEQIDMMALMNPVGFKSAADSIRRYLERGDKIREAVGSLFLYIDKKLTGRLSTDLPQETQKIFKKDVQAVLVRMRSEHQEILENPYKVCQINVSEEIESLCNGARVLAPEARRDDEKEVPKSPKKPKD